MSTTDRLKSAIGARTPAPVRSTAVAAAKPKTLAGIVCSDGFKEQLKLALPKSMTADRMARIVLTECRRTPELLNTNQESFLGAVLQCAQLGLEPGSALGHCYLLPFGSGKARDGKPNCQLIIGYRGMIDLARRSGQIVSICAYTVHEKDDFAWKLGLDPNIHHIPSPEANRGKMTYVYAVAKLKDGGVQFEVMSRADVEAVRKQSKAGGSGPWATHFPEMAKKTVIRRLFKYLPVSIEAARAVEVDERSDMGEAITPDDVIEGCYVEGRVEELPPETHPAEDASITDVNETGEVEGAETAEASAPAGDPWLDAFDQKASAS